MDSANILCHILINPWAFLLMQNIWRGWTWSTSSEATQKSRQLKRVWNDFYMLFFYDCSTHFFCQMLTVNMKKDERKHNGIISLDSCSIGLYEHKAWEFSTTRYNNLPYLLDSIRRYFSEKKGFRSITNFHLTSNFMWKLFSEVSENFQLFYRETFSLPGAGMKVFLQQNVILEN